VAVVGLQGVGKTSAFMALSNALCEDPQASGDIVFFKWPSDGDWKEAVWGWGWDGLEDDYDHMLIEALSQALEADKIASRRLQKKKGDNVAWALRARARGQESGIDTPDYELADIAREWSPKERVTKLRDEVIRNCVARAHTVLIDMPDYSKRDTRLFTRDLTKIQELWTYLTYFRSSPNLIVFFQRELFRGHFLLGKMDVVTLDPFTPEQLVAAYEQKFKDSYPFDKSALLELACMSRGIFRRFLKYIRMCIEELLSKSESERVGVIPLSVEFVRGAVGLEQIMADMELELVDVFPKVETRLFAVKIIESIRSNTGMNQNELAQALEMDDSTLARVLSKLEAHRYIVRKRGERGEKRITLA
jgi:uncharacterized membrane protein